MLILNIENIKDFSFPKTAVALGSFEALHAGHIKIIENTVKCAKENNIKSVITIFREPILKNKSSVCETLDERLDIIEGLHADIVVVFDFNEKFKNIEYKDFFHKYITKTFNAKYIFTGFNYKFGYKAMGNTENLLTLCEENNISLNVMPAVAVNNKIISSTYVHNLIENGEAENLSSVLLRPYSVSGTVTSGRRIGHELNFPTANIDFPANKAVIKYGVYFGAANTEYGTYYTIINVGPQPTVSDEYTPKIEAYLINFEKNLYNTPIKLNFLKRLRDIKKFSNADELKKQLEDDKRYAEIIIESIKKANT